MIRSPLINRSLTLKQRFIVACVVLTAFIALFFSSMLYFVVHSLETELFGDAMKSQINWFIQLEAQGRLDDFAPPEPWKIYNSTASDESDLPEKFRGKSPGFHEIEMKTEDYHIYVVEKPAHKYILTFEQTAFEVREQQIMQLLVFMVFLSIAFGLVVAYKLTNIALSPVTNLAQRVSEIDVNIPGEKLASYYQDDVVGQLASEFDEQIKHIRYYLLQEKLFTGDVSHELLTPLTIISGAVDVLEQQNKFSEKTEGAVKRIGAATKHMAKLVNAFLKLSNQQKDASNFQSHISVNSLVADQIVLAKDGLSQFPEKCVFKENAILRINAVAELLEIVIRNLIHNAVNYTENGRLTVIVNHNSVVIEDTGKGISSAILDRVFNQGKKLKFEEVQGHGFGLAIVNRICEINEWEIQVNSTPQGTKFTITFMENQILKPEKW